MFRPKGRRLLIMGKRERANDMTYAQMAGRASGQPRPTDPRRRRQLPRPPMWHDKIPFLIRLRDFAEGKLPTLPQLPLSYPGLELLGEPEEEWVRARLDDGRALVLVDGLDEVTKERRQLRPIHGLMAC